MGRLIGIKNVGSLKDSIRYLDPVWIPDAKIGQGCIIGLVGGLMVVGGRTFEDAVKTIVHYGNEMKDFSPSIQRIPSAWRSEFVKYGW